LPNCLNMSSMSHSIMMFVTVIRKRRPFPLAKI
jgi:hypothetical protein